MKVYWSEGVDLPPSVRLATLYDSHLIPHCVRNDSAAFGCCYLIFPALTQHELLRMWLVKVAGCGLQYQLATKPGQAHNLLFTGLETVTE